MNDPRRQAAPRESRRELHGAAWIRRGHDIGRYLRQGVDQAVCPIGGDGDEQSAGGLRVGEYANQYLIVDLDFQPSADVIDGRLVGSGHDALPREFEGALEQRYARRVDLDGDARRLGHLVRVTDEAEAGDVGCGVDAYLSHRLGRTAVQFGHHLDCFGKIGFGHLVGLDGAGEHTAADGFRQHQPIAGLRAAVGHDALRVDRAGDGQSVFDLRVAHAVPADGDGTEAVGTNLISDALTDDPEGTGDEELE